MNFLAQYSAMTRCYLGRSCMSAPVSRYFATSNGLPFSRELLIQQKHSPVIVSDD